MRIEHDKVTDSAYLALVDVDGARSEPLLPWLVADVDAMERIIGLEVLDASRHLDLARSGPVVELVGTREAAAVFGVRPPNFIRDWASRSDFPKPLAELASTRAWDRREPTGLSRRPPRSRLMPFRDQVSPHALRQAARRKVPIGLIDAEWAYQENLDDRRAIDCAADGAVMGIEFLSASRGVALDGLPYVDDVERILGARAFRVLRPH